MRTPAAFLKTRIARRIFGLFLLCAVLPTGTLAVASYWMVSREMRVQAEAQLGQTAKVSGTVLLARLHQADGDLAELTRLLRRDSLPADQARKFPRFDGVGIARRGEAGRPVLGAPFAIPPEASTAEALHHLGLGRSLVLVLSDGTAPQIVMARAADTRAPQEAIVYGFVSPEHLWGGHEVESLVPADTDMCVYAFGIVEPIHCSEAGVEARVRAAFAAGADSVVGGLSEVFLNFDYAAPPWTVRVSRPLTTFRAPIEFRRSVLLTLALGVWLVVLASNVLLRHRLDPVARLLAATRRLAAGDFTASVALSTRDELEDLADAFNTMARGLRDQFTLLSALHEVDRAALGGHSDVEVARAALLHFPRLVSMEEAILVVRPPAGDAPDQAAVWRVDSTGRVGQQHVALPPSGFTELEREPDGWQLAPGAPHPVLVEALEPAAGRVHLVLPLASHGSCFAAVILTVGASAGGFTESETRRARHVADQVALALRSNRLVQRLNAMSWDTLAALARSIDAVSPWTAGHSERVTRLGLAIGRELELAPERIDQLHRGGLLHDIGKIGVPSAILDKPAKLDDAEFAAIRAHPVIGARILEPIQAYDDVIPIVRHHHERYDGTGYPDRLAGRAIPYLARVLSVADVYDALVSKRPYRDGWRHEAAVEYISNRSGIEFDPEVVAAFLRLMDRGKWADPEGEGEAPVGARPLFAESASRWWVTGGGAE